MLDENTTKLNWKGKKLNVAYVSSWKTWDLVQVHYRSQFSIKQMFILIQKSFFSRDVHHLEQKDPKVIMPPYCLDILIYFLLF